MELYPAVDIRGGVVARSVGHADPVVVAKAFVAQGAAWVHVVDLDAVFGTGDNLDAVCRVCHLAGVRVQVGGNLTEQSRIRAVVAAGAERVILGTVAGLDAGALDALRGVVGAAEWAVALEVNDGRVFLRDTGETSDQSVEAFVDRARVLGARHIVYRDVDRDGALAGADVGGVSDAVGRGVAILYAGGVESVSDIRRLAQVGVDGVIVGRALLDGRFTVAEALACLV